MELKTLSSLQSKRFGTNHLKPNGEMGSTNKYIERPTEEFLVKPDLKKQFSAFSGHFVNHDVTGLFCENL